VGPRSVLDVVGRDHFRNLEINGKIKIKMDLREVGWGDMNRIKVTQTRDQLSSHQLLKEDN
jgi:hypothetical protein